ncbi:ABC transporter permease [Cellulomonas timonensis]|uniref:ABC transporter permease n=1 Tax=Cellulomonas timonensis TaxID=1689271 RepID=UPI00082B7E50|nr:ABC transporter permease [Cellulomonas timonensis]
MPDAPVRPDQAHFFAADTELGLVDQVDETSAPTSLWADAWQNLRRRPLFWVSAALIALVLLVAAFPSMFTSLDPRFCELRNSLGEPTAGHPFGFDRQGCDIYARTIYGARASVATGVLTTLLVLIVGGIVGGVAGFYGGWFDSLLSRVTDIFFAIPLVLAAIVVMQMFKESRNILTVVLVLGIFGWPQLARVTRGAVVAVRHSEFVTAARALGASRLATLIRHVAPNASGPVIVTSTVALGTYIVAEATLSFLGIGLPPQITSWGADIAKAQTSLRSEPMVLFYPSAALALTVLSFIMMGDAVRDALDPKARTR